MRVQLAEWGLQSLVDYNITDVVPSRGTDRVVFVEVVPRSENNNDTFDSEPETVNVSREKTRGYDFVLPYNTPGWSPRIFIQCQFYAGDSGSVSHKNVDQTQTSRTKVQEFAHNPIFIEYVDGAGYFSSLNGDLKKLLQMPTTASFIQIRSACIRLRRKLQEIGYLTPLEIEHSLLRAGGNVEHSKNILIGEGYSPDEIQRCWNSSVERGILQSNGFEATIRPDRLPIARRHLLLDIAAIYGKSLTNDNILGSFLIPGYGPFYGMKLEDLVAQAIEIAPGASKDLSNSTVLLSDMRWLSEQRWIMTR